jgi:hypothetical protein
VRQELALLLPSSALLVQQAVPVQRHYQPAAEGLPMDRWELVKKRPAL